jgi:putative transposase
LIYLLKSEGGDMSIGSGVLTPHKAINKEHHGAKATLPTNGTDTLVSVKSKCNTEVPHPNGTDTSVSAKSKCAQKYSRLPHIDLLGYYQFVTFRTYESLDEFMHKFCLSPALSNKEKQLKIDEYLDTSSNGAYLQDEVLEWLFEFLLHQDKKLYELVAFAIMNNHVHILFKSLQSLSKVMQRIKGVSAKRINELLSKNGKFWADDYYDKAIRDERHFWVVYEYIKNNPLKISGTRNNGGAKTAHPNGTDTLVSAKSMCGTEVPHPSGVGNNGGAKTAHPNGTDTSVSAKSVCGTEAAHPNGTDTSVSAKSVCGTEAAHPSGAKAPLPRFYGVYE